MTLAVGSEVHADDLTGFVNSICGRVGRARHVDTREDAFGKQKPMVHAAAIPSPDYVSRPVDSVGLCKGCAGIVNGGVGFANQFEPLATGSCRVCANDHAGVVHAIQFGPPRPRIIDQGKLRALEEKAVIARTAGQSGSISAYNLALVVDAESGTVHLPGKVDHPEGEAYVR